jgi:hypothetical protein
VLSDSDDPEDFLDFRDESHWVEFTITLEAFEWPTGNTIFQSMMKNLSFNSNREELQ